MLRDSHVVGWNSMAVDQYSFKKLALRKFPKLDKKESRESSFWKKFQVSLNLLVQIIILY